MEREDNGLRVPFGLKNGRLYRPEETDRGLVCGCICPGCGSALIANQGKAKQAYFSHYQSRECEGGYESAIHLMAKQVINCHKWLVIPEYSKTISRRMPTGRVFEETIEIQSTRVNFKQVLVEKGVDGLRPDLIGVAADGTEFFIEVYVTHAVTDDKRNRYKHQNLIELDLSQLPRDTISDESMFTKSVLSGADRHWVACLLYRDKYKELHQSFRSKIKQYISEHRVRVEEVKSFLNELEQVRRLIQQATIKKEPMPELTKDAVRMENTDQLEGETRQYDKRYEQVMRPKSQWYEDRQGRIGYLVSLAAYLYYRRGLSKVMKCNKCSHFQEISNGSDCLECGQPTLRNVELTPGYIQSLPKRLQQASLSRF